MSAAMLAERPTVAEADLHPIGGPSAWHGDAMTVRSDWRRTLMPAEAEAILTAARRQREAGGPAFGFGADAFRIPALRPVLDWVADQLENGPGLVRLSGLPVEGLELDDLRRAFWGFCANLGTPVMQTAAGERLGEVRDETGTGTPLTYDGPGPLKTARTVSRSTAALRFHTDKTDVLSLFCASNGISGGESKVVSSVAIHDEIARTRPDLLRVLYAPYWRMKPTDEEGAGAVDPVFPMAVFARGPDGKFTSQYSRTYVNLAQEVAGVPKLTAQQDEALDLLHAVGERLCLTMPFVPGDMQFMNQHVTYHGRTAYNDGASGGRRLLRVWLSVPGSRALPAGHAVQWGDVRAGALRGGAVPGTSALAA